MSQSPQNDLRPIRVPETPATPLHPRDILLGRAVVTPLQVIQTYSAHEWERFVEEWAVAKVPHSYAAVFRAPGSGDQGRDVLGYVEETLATSAYDNYQCKHYDKPLSPTIVWEELAKLCWYTFSGAYRVPRRYVFVAPHGIGPKLLRLLEQPAKLRAGLIENWGIHGASKIASGQRIALDGALLAYVQAFDFSIVGALPPTQLIEEHETSRFHAMRFGGGLRRQRPPAQQPPAQIAAEETVYVRRLLDAYGESLRIPLADESSLGQASASLHDHLKRQREWFFKAATLRQFERDSLPHDAGFVDLMRQVHEAVIDTHALSYQNGLARLHATMTLAAQLNVSSYVLRDFLEPADLKGVCHHLANDRDDFCWCDHAEAA